ncbi:MAG: hypothetical protein A3A33_04330 [Candidatus Yanofskybacteria bacterium RIFCSPLOWO2_01_FULL_49_25]|uniref:Uncharacterized protein n=1 Tax=Candidatus Yanofskybacteria bacterium RIFCSPLOWO2_01_FULL_49_25 TaxID=1802701 RepID=A0A1F8GWM7_9BACT|nr:MAG: hypothetical protein A3A33_04330 [Candidatus Yanofskybacteria bacterium RIFCSPLOWO2_01_FULL_49_25]
MQLGTRISAAVFCVLVGIAVAATLQDMRYQKIKAGWAERDQVRNDRAKAEQQAWDQHQDEVRAYLTEWTNTRWCANEERPCTPAQAITLAKAVMNDEPRAMTLGEFRAKTQKPTSTTPPADARLKEGREGPG